MNRTAQDLWSLLEGAGAERVERFDPTALGDLPEPAQRFLTAAISANAPLADGVELEMTGRIKLGLWLLSPPARSFAPV